MHALAAAARLSHPGSRSRRSARIPCGRLGMSGRHCAARLKECEKEGGGKKKKQNDQIGQRSACPEEPQKKENIAPHTSPSASCDSTQCIGESRANFC